MILLHQFMYCCTFKDLDVISEVFELMPRLNLMYDSFCVVEMYSECSREYEVMALLSSRNNCFHSVINSNFLSVEIILF